MQLFALIRYQHDPLVKFATKLLQYDLRGFDVDRANAYLGFCFVFYLVQKVSLGYLLSPHFGIFVEMIKYVTNILPLALVDLLLNKLHRLLRYSGTKLMHFKLFRILESRFAIPLWRILRKSLHRRILIPGMVFALVIRHSD